MCSSDLTIYTFKNYFAIVISAISFQFQQNKSYPNRPLKSVIEKRVFSVNKTKICVWDHCLNNIFQCSKNVKYVFGMCVFNDKKS